MTTDLGQANEQLLRRGFKYLNRFMLLMWRLGWGKWINIWPQKAGRIMVIVHTGRKSGLQRRTPVNYAIVDGELYCTSGFGRRSDWYRNIMAHPQVEVWLPDGRWVGEAADVTDHPRATALLREVLIASGFAAEIAGMHPRQMSEAALQAAVADYRLVRIHRTRPITGPGGPGDLAWVWWVLGAMCVVWRWRRRKARS